MKLKLDMQTYLEDFFLSMNAIRRNFFLSIKAIDYDRKKLYKIFQTATDDGKFKSKVESIFKKHQAQNPLNIDEVEQSNKNIQNELKANGIIFVTSNKASAQKHSQLYVDINQQIERIQQLIFQTNIIRETSLVNYFTCYENLLSNIIDYYYRSNRNHLETSTQISLKQLREFQSVENVEDFIIEQKVKNLMMKSIDDIRSYFSHSFHFETEFYAFSKDYLIEISERRNCVIHNGNRISKAYVDKTSRDNNKSIGKHFNHSNAYLKSAYETLLADGIFLIAQLWKQYDLDANPVTEDEAANMNYSIDRSLFSLLKEKSWMMSKFVYKSLLANPKFVKSRELYYLNLALCEDSLGEENVEETIKRLDLSKLDDKIKIGYYAILCDYDSIIEIISRKGFDDLNAVQFEQFPIFNKIRNNDKTKYNEILDILTNLE